MVEGGEDGREKARKKKEKKIFTKKFRIFTKKVSNALKIRVADVPCLVSEKCQNDTTRRNMRCLK